MSLFRLVLSFTFRPADEPEDANLDEERQVAVEETRQFFHTTTTLDQYVKERFDATQFFREIFSEEWDRDIGTLESAEWGSAPGLQLCVSLRGSPTTTCVGIRRFFKMQSLEDGPYESCDENGWIIRTRCNEYEYAYLDYRSNPIAVTRVRSTRK